MKTCIQNFSGKRNTARLPHDAGYNYVILCDSDLLKDREYENKYICGVKAWKMTKDQVQHADTLLHIIETIAETVGLWLIFRSR